MTLPSAELTPSARAAAGQDARLRAPAAPQAPGLVLLKTSDTPIREVFDINPDETRLVRLQRMVLWGARLIEHQLMGRGFLPAMLTLTYADVDGFRPRHISELFKRVRQWMARRKYEFCYVWVAELQKRGALHYHVILWLPATVKIPKPDRQGWWPHGSTRIEWARDSVGYLCKYATKFDSKLGLPKGARLHGGGGFGPEAKQIRRWLNLPSWLKRLAGIDSRFVRVEGVGLVDGDTGVCVSSPWRVSCHGGRISATKLFDYIGGLAETPGPFSFIGAPHLLDHVGTA